MKPLNNPLKSAMRDVCLRHGYKFLKGVWSRDLQEVVQILDLNKSTWGDNYYLDAGVWLKSLGEPERYLVRFAHFQFRFLDTLDPNFGMVLSISKNADTLAPEDRRVLFGQLLEKHTMPIMDGLTSVDELRRSFEYVLRRNVAVMKEARLIIWPPEVEP
ncbi:MAG: hypothetical protein ACRC1K_02520 [Planctomycetia bacterium]